MPESLTAPAPAKINLVLEVLGKREDGYHEIDTILQTLELADQVTLHAGGAPAIRITGDYAEGTPTDDSNLVWRARHELDRLCGGDSSLQWDVHKKIPPASGLGGGASDAATALRLLQRLRTEVGDEALLAAANAVGSDEAFFLSGGTARATGRGERVTSLPPLVQHGIVLFVSPGTLVRKTPRLFEALDTLPFDDGSVAASWVANPPTTIRPSDVYNAFERVAFDVFPGLAKLWEDLETRIGEPIHLAGAGPTLFWIGPPGDAAAVAVKADGLPCTVIETRTSPSLWRR